MFIFKKTHFIKFLFHFCLIHEVMKSEPCWQIALGLIVAVETKILPRHLQASCGTYSVTSWSPSLPLPMSCQILASSASPMTLELCFCHKFIIPCHSWLFCFPIRTLIRRSLLVLFFFSGSHLVNNTFYLC